MEDSRLLVVYNPISQGGKSIGIFRDFIDFLDNQSSRYEVYQTKGENDHQEIRELLINESFETICVIGGDGTLNIVVNGLPNFDIPILILPAGTGNDFNKMVNPKSSTTELFHLVNHPQSSTAVDIWRCNDSLFINAFGIGFDGSIVQEMNENQSKVPLKLKYWIAIFKQLFFYKSKTYFINGRSQEAFMVTLANGRVFGGDFKIAPKASINDGLLELILIRKIPVPLRMFYLPILQFGKHLGLKIVKYSRVESCTISADEPMYGQIDGEIITNNTFSISYAGKLKVLK